METRAPKLIAQVEAHVDVTRIIIVGGGFAGVCCARVLRKRLTEEACEIVLFDRENSMVYYPLLAEVAGATIGPDSIATPLRQLLPRVRCRTEEVHRIDHAASEVEYGGYDGRLGDCLRLLRQPRSRARHVRPCVPAEVGGRCHGVAVSRDGATQKAEVCDDPERRRWYLSFVIVGGGFSGVEIAGELNDLVRASIRFYSNFTARNVTVTSVNARHQILPEVSPTLREFARMKMEQAGIHIILNTRVVLATADGVGLADGRMIGGATIVCSIGMTAAQLVRWLDTPKEKDRLVTDPDMRLRGIANVWAVGDCAMIVNAYDQNPAPATGQFAERQGRQVAENILRVLQGQPTRPFAYRSLGTLCGIGERNAVAEI